MKYIGIYGYGPGIGDKIQFSAIPENYYKSTGEKLVDIEKCWVFDHNPYVLRGNYQLESSVNLWNLQLTKEALSKEELFNEIFEIKTFLRHPRLYIYEDLTPDYYSITIHTNGKSRGGEMSQKIIDQIIKNYPNHKIYQIGGKEDKKTPFIDSKGLSIWETAKLIASCGTFIGVNSSMMNLAKCYPKVRKKVLFNEKNCPDWRGNEELKTFKPVSPKDTWIDYNWEYFNTTEADIGITNTYFKI